MRCLYTVPCGGCRSPFKDYSVYRGIEASPWVGLKHFISFFNSPYVYRLFRNTILIGAYGILFGFPASIILALLLNEVRSKKFKSIVQTCTYLPYFISSVVIAGIITSFLAPSSGLINIIIEKLAGEKIYFLSKAEYFRSIYTIMGIWTGIGYNSIVYIAALSGIDSQLYESLYHRWRRPVEAAVACYAAGIAPHHCNDVYHITLGNIMNVSYENIILLYQPATYETADVINSYVYRMGIENADYSLSAAAGMLNFRNWLRIGNGCKYNQQ